jgi:hypothetical protein
MRFQSLRDCSLSNSVWPYGLVRKRHRLTLMASTSRQNEFIREQQFGLQRSRHLGWLGCSVCHLIAGGPVVVKPDLSVSGHADIYIIGDLAHIEIGKAVVPGVPPAAMHAG